MKRLSYILLLLASMIALAGCTDYDIVPVGGGDAVELADIAPQLSRATVAPLADYVGKPEFDDKDSIVFTAVRRTNHPIDQFNYVGLEYDCAKSQTDDGKTSIGWTRNPNKGHNLLSNTEVHPDRIYWSDAVSPHTFIGYCKPQQGSGELAFDWNMRTVETLNTYFGSIGIPTETGVVDFQTTGNTELCKNDILLTHSESITASDAVAQLKFHHGLAQVRVIVSISDFAAGGGADTTSVVSDMVLKDMLTMYKWKGQSAQTERLISADQATLDVIYTSPTVPYDQKKNFQLWIPKPTGVGSRANKTFTFYGLAVPTLVGKDAQDKTYTETVNFGFKVTYPNPMNPTEKKEASYAGSIGDIRFDAGKCTTINITLNHRNEKMTVGAEYDEWDFVDTPDQGALKKHSTFLASTARNESDGTTPHVTIATDAKATVDDATWLYMDGGTLKDVYGNDGTSAHPFTISTADELLSFAYEVNSGREFEGLYVKLDADITLQPSTQLSKAEMKAPASDADEATKKQYENAPDALEWIGIGEGSNYFNGVFLGGSRHINRLYGAPFFTKVGKDAVVDKLNFSSVIEVHGPGVVAQENNGLICSCYIDGNVKENHGESEYSGSIVGTNNSFIVACTHIGDVTGPKTVGGLVGYNNGTVIACYHSGGVTTKTPVGSGGVAHPSVGEYGDGTNNTNHSFMFSCYYDSRVFKGSPILEAGKRGYPFSTAVMQSHNFVDGQYAYTFDAQGAHTVTSKTIKTVLKELLDEADILDGSMQVGLTEEEEITGMMQQLITHDKEQNDISKMLTFKLYEYHFSLNQALSVFRYWTHAMPEGEEVTTNCHTFTAAQIAFLKAHYDGSHIYKYIPATYPKTQ